MSQWLCDLISREATEVAAQFLRFGLIQLVSDKDQDDNSAVIFAIQDSTVGGNPSIVVRCCFFVLSIYHNGASTGYW